MSIKERDNKKEKSTIKSRWNRIKKWRPTFSTFMMVFTIAVFIYILLPVFVVFSTAFTENPMINFPPQGFSLYWFERVWHSLLDHSEGFYLFGYYFKLGLADSLFWSLIVGVAAALGAVGAGVPAAIAIHKYDFPGKAFIEQLFLLPLIYPQIVTGIALLMIYSTYWVFWGLHDLFRIVIGHIILVMPFVIRNCLAVMKMIDPTIEESALIHGASKTTAFFKITLPLIKPGVIAGAILAFLISFDNFTITFFLYTGYVRPMPLWVYEYIRFMIDPTLSALSIILITITLTAMILLDRLIGIQKVVV